MVDDSHFVRASLNAVLAAYTPLPVNVDYPFGGRIDRGGGTNPLTRSVLTMIALNRDKLLVIGRVPTQVPLQYPVEPLVVIELVVILTSQLAGMTANALGSINRDSVTRHVQLREIRELRGGPFCKKVPPRPPLQKLLYPVYRAASAASESCPANKKKSFLKGAWGYTKKLFP